MDTKDSCPGPRVATYALIGRGEELLVHDNGDGSCSLPGTAVRDGELVEAALRRAVTDQLATGPADVDFCTVVEHALAPEVHGSPTELAFLFDVTFADQCAEKPTWPGRFRWEDNESVSSRLRPLAVRTLHLRGLLSSRNPWHAWLP
ncbi:hypothetical protein GCM10023192_88340 [Amycolatopsis samaneae]